MKVVECDRNNNRNGRHRDLYDRSTLDTWLCCL